MPAGPRQHQKWKDTYKTKTENTAKNAEKNLGLGMLEKEIWKLNLTMWDEIGNYFQINQKYIYLPKLYQ